MTKDNKVKISATDPVMVEILKRMGCRQEVRAPIAHDPVGPHMQNQQNISYPQKQASHTIESLERLEREDLFGIADYFGVEYAKNIPTARLIDNIMARQDETR